MTRRQRAQVVELLRCAADGDPHRPDAINGRLRAESGLSIDTFGQVAILAYRAVNAVDTGAYDEEGYRAELLEAAQRIEEGWTP